MNQSRIKSAINSVKTALSELRQMKPMEMPSLKVIDDLEQVIDGLNAMVEHNQALDYYAGAEETKRKIGAIVRNESRRITSKLKP